MRQIKKGDIVTLKATVLEPNEPNPPHVALEDGFNGTVKVKIAGDCGLVFPPVNIWNLDWIA